MKKFFLFVVALIIGFIVTFEILTLSTGKKVDEPKKENVPLATNFSIETPPSQALKGDVTAFSGNVSWQSRIASMPAEVTTISTIQQGEEIVTGIDGTLQVQFSSLCVITLMPETHLNFAQTLPEALVIQQKKGEATYEKSCTSPLSIRALHLLVQINKGETIISIDNGIITMTVVSGQSTIAYNDDENISQILHVNEEETLIFDDESRTVEFE